MFRSRRLALLVLALACLSTACSTGQPATFAVTSASVDPVYACPAGSTDARYDVHAALNVRNGTGRGVTIESVTAEMRLVAVHGPWLEKVGDVYDAGSAEFSPASVGARSASSLHVTIASTCTSDRNASGASSHGDYSVTMHLVTSAGRFTVTAGNPHEIRAG